MFPTFSPRVLAAPWRLRKDDIMGGDKECSNHLVFVFEVMNIFI